MDTRPGEVTLPTRDVVRHETAKALLEKELADRRLRNSRYSMRAFARSVGLSQTQLSLILSGKRDVSLPQAMKLAQALTPGVPTLEKLLGISFFDVVGSRRGVPGAAESGSLAKLENGVVVTAREWPTYAPLVERFFGTAPEGSLLFLAIRAAAPARPNG